MIFIYFCDEYVLTRYNKDFFEKSNRSKWSISKSGTFWTKIGFLGYFVAHNI